MKLTKTAKGYKVVLSTQEWKNIGLGQGWIKSAQMDGSGQSLPPSSAKPVKPVEQTNKGSGLEDYASWAITVYPDGKARLRYVEAGPNGEPNYNDRTVGEIFPGHANFVASILGCKVENAKSKTAQTLNTQMQPVGTGQAPSQNPQNLTFGGLMAQQPQLYQLYNQARLAIQKNQPNANQLKMTLQGQLDKTGVNWHMMPELMELLG